MTLNYNNYLDFLNYEQKKAVKDSEGSCLVLAGAGSKGKMVGQTVTRAHLGEAVYQEVGLSRNESMDLLEMVIDFMGDALVKGKTVKVSSFGSFSSRQKKQRIGRNPKTGEEVPILPRKVLVFRPSQVLKSRVNERLERT